MNKGNIVVGIAFSVIIMGLLVIFHATLTNRRNGQTNTAYVRVQNCILGITATTRTAEDIDHCYKTIEREFDVKLVRYDKM